MHLLLSAIERSINSLITAGERASVKPFDRRLLYSKRLSFAIFRDQLISEISLLPLELRGNFDLRVGLDYLLAQVCCLLLKTGHGMQLIRM